MEGKSSNETNPSPDKSHSLLDSLLGVCFIGFVLYLVFCHVSQLSRFMIG